MNYFMGEISFITAFVEWFKITYNYKYLSYEFLFWSIYYLYKEINPDCSNYKPAMVFRDIIYTKQEYNYLEYCLIHGFVDVDNYPYKMGRWITKEELDLIPKQYYITSSNLINVRPNNKIEVIEENKWLMLLMYINTDYIIEEEGVYKYKINYTSDFDVFKGRDAFLAFIKTDETKETTVLAKPVGRLSSRYSSILINIKMLYHYCQFFSIELLNTSNEDIEVSTSLLNLFDVKICEDITNTTINNYYPIFIHEYVKSVAHYNIFPQYDFSDVEVTSVMEYEEYERPFAISRYVTDDRDLIYDDKWLRFYAISGYQVIPYSSSYNHSFVLRFKYFGELFQGITMAYIRNIDKDQDMRQIKQSSSKNILEKDFVIRMKKVDRIAFKKGYIPKCYDYKLYTYLSNDLLRSIYFGFVDIESDNSSITFQLNNNGVKLSYSTVDNLFPLVQGSVYVNHTKTYTNMMIKPIKFKLCVQMKYKNLQLSKFINVKMAGKTENYEQLLEGNKNDLYFQCNNLIPKSDVIIRSAIGDIFELTDENGNYFRKMFRDDKIIKNIKELVVSVFFSPNRVETIRQTLPSYYSNETIYINSYHGFLNALQDDKVFFIVLMNDLEGYYKPQNINNFGKDKIIDGQNHCIYLNVISDLFSDFEGKIMNMNLVYNISDNAGLMYGIFGKEFSGIMEDVSIIIHSSYGYNFSVIAETITGKISNLYCEIIQNNNDDKIVTNFSLLGKVCDNCILDKITVVGDLYGKSVFGLVEKCVNCVVSNCVVESDIYFISEAAGLIYESYDSEILNCSYIGKMKNVAETLESSSSYVCGGIIGRLNNSIIDNCNAELKIEMNNKNEDIDITIGGIVGYSSKSTIKNSISGSEYLGYGKYVGVVCGRMEMNSHAINCTGGGKYWDFTNGKRKLKLNGTVIGGLCVVNDSTSTCDGVIDYYPSIIHNVKNNKYIVQSMKKYNDSHFIFNDYDYYESNKFDFPSRIKILYYSYIQSMTIFYGEKSISHGNVLFGYKIQEFILLDEHIVECKIKYYNENYIQYIIGFDFTSDKNSSWTFNCENNHTFIETTIKFPSGYGFSFFGGITSQSIPSRVDRSYYCNVKKYEHHHTTFEEEYNIESLDFYGRIIPTFKKHIYHSNEKPMTNKFVQYDEMYNKYKLSFPSYMIIYYNEYYINDISLVYGNIELKEGDHSNDKKKIIKYDDLLHSVAFIFTDEPVKHLIGIEYQYEDTKYLFEINKSDKKDYFTVGNVKVGYINELLGYETIDGRSIDFINELEIIERDY